jgi:uncharacterized protein
VPSEKPILIVGASARAAAFSGCRAGLRPWCADLFADSDLEQVCTAIRIAPREFPNRLLRLLDNAPAGPWLYTGGLENRPHFVQQMAQVRPLWGNDANVLRRVRQPWEVATFLKGAGLPCPEVRFADRPGRADGNWLVKPLAGAGGHGIHVWSGQCPAKMWSSEGVFLQEYIEGDPCAAVYVAGGHRTMLLGVTRQLVGEAWLRASRYHYCGSVGPLDLAKEIEAAFVLLGHALANGFGLRGLFGVDCVLRDGVPYPVEINPRYTASVEVLEHATGMVAMDLHRQAFVMPLAFAPLTPDPFPRKRGEQNVVGKVILFARERLTVPVNGPWTSAFDQPATELRTFADIPHVGEVIDQGKPIVTLLGRANTAGHCLEDLRERVQTLDRWLFER